MRVNTRLPGKLRALDLGQQNRDETHLQQKIAAPPGTLVGVGLFIARIRRNDRLCSERTAAAKPL